MNELEDKDYSTRWLLTKTLFSKDGENNADDNYNKVLKDIGIKSEKAPEDLEWVDDIIDLDFVKKANRASDKQMDGKMVPATTLRFMDSDTCVIATSFEEVQQRLEKREKFLLELRVAK